MKLIIELNIKILLDLPIVRWLNNFKINRISYYLGKLYIEISLLELFIYYKYF